MAAEGRGRRELLALIHQHLLRAGYARAARELQAQLGQKLLPSLATSLEEIFTHWEKTPSKAKRRKVSDEEAAIPEKIRVPDPVSSSESSEKEEDEKEKTKTGNATSLSPVTNSAVNVESSEDDDSSSEEETPSGKGAITVTPAAVSGKAANSLHSPIKSTAPGRKVVVPSAANRTVLSNKQQPNAPAMAPAKAGQKLPGPGKSGRAVAAVSQAGQSKAPVMTKAPESSSSSSSSSESEEEKETLTVKAPAPKVELKQATESSSEESSDETLSEKELATTAVQAKPAAKAVQVNSTPVKSAPATSVSTKKSAVKQRAVPLNQAKHGSVTVPVAAKPDDTSESSDSSDSGNEEPPSVVTQTKPSLKTSQAIPSPVKTTPAASLSSKAAPAKTLPLSQGKPAPKPAVLKQTKATPGRTAAPAKPAESTNPAESTDSSDSEEEDLPVPVSQKRLPEQPGPVPSLSQAAKAATPEKAVGSTLKNETSKSGSSDSSDSEEETLVSQAQPALPAVKSNAMPQPTSVKKVSTPTPAPAPPLPMDSSDDSSEESDSDEEIVPPTQTLSQQNIKPTKVSSTVAAKANATPPSGKGIKAPPIPPVSRVSESSNSDSSESNTVVGEAVPPSCLKQTAPTGKAPPASSAAPQAVSILRSPTAKSKKPGPQPAQDARLSQTAPLTQAEESSDSSSSSDSDKETPKQPPKPAGMLQKPGGTEPDDSSSSDSSEDEEAESQSLLTGYTSLSKSPAAPQAPKTVPPQPVGNAGQGKAAVNATSSLAKVSVKATPADSSSSDSSDSDTDVEQVSANHKAESKPPPGQEATGASSKEKVAGKIDASHANPKPSPVKKALAAKENDVEAKESQVTPLPPALLSTPQPEESSLGSRSEVTTAAGVPAVQTPEGLEEKKKKKKEKKEKKEKKKPSSTADKAVKTSKGKDKENKKQKASRKRPGEDGAVGQPKEKKRKGQDNEEVPKKKKKKAADDPEKLPGSKEKKKSSKKKKAGKEKKNKKMSTEGEPAADGSAEVPKKKKKKKKTAEPEGLL
ncbi:treacle protein isoform X1 [Numida meleagris]|uniref:treacle protein isoform X1 n=1 Tax=Numida meleagris TaxID=8996 RepID=UPI000B3E239E|nr:treacle protein isoform X1 [Numida meleagris]XP_021265787.1 treacle protein isoform X1 [Numida meleagris]